MIPDSSDHIQLLKKSTGLLGWDLIRQTLAGLAWSAPTQDKCRALYPEPDFEAAQRALEETAEMVSLHESGESLPLNPFDDVHQLLGDMDERGIIEPAQGLQVLKFLRLAKSIKNFFAKKSGRLHEYAARLDPLPSLRKELDRCIDDEGQIKENASPELKQAYRDVRAAKDKLEKSINKLMGSPAFKDALQDSYATERGGRLVLPIKSEWKSQVDGIVHDSSGSGATLYLEPAKIVPLNNQLKIDRIKVEQEKLKVLRLLSGAVMSQKEILKVNQEILVTFDLVHAKFRLADTLQARHFVLNREGRVRLKQARNPELVLARQQVVPNDIHWDDASRVIIISGPNTGGKTVTLKTIGLMALMARAGLFLPVDENSEIGFFPQVYADIGDEQNIQQSLSTFSAHLGKIITILENALPGSLILLDELGIATDPLQGAALAEAILMELKQKGMMTLVSTHFLSLKTLAQTQDGFLNACTEFDQDSLKPTYKLIFGVPGASAALETAERMGLRREIIVKAQGIYNQKDTAADSLLQILNKQKMALEREKESLANLVKETEKLKDEQRAITENLRTQELAFQKNKAKRLQGAVKDAKNKIQRMMVEIKGTPNLGKMRKAEKQIHAVGRVPHATAPPDLTAWNIPADQLKKGDTIIVEAYGTRGKLLENPQGKKKVRIKLGNLEPLVDLKRLRGQSKKAPRQGKPAAKVEITVQTETKSLPAYCCDLRGLRVEEGKSALESFIDRATLNDMSRIKILHGHGTGAMKKMVRDYLKSGGIGKKFTPGSSKEGGDGVTIIEF